MSAILKFDFLKTKQFHFSEEHYLNYTKKKTQFYMWHLYTFSLKQGETRRAGSGSIWVPLKVPGAI